MARKSVLVTGLAIDEAAESRLISEGVDIIYAGSALASAELAALAAQHQVHGIIVRQGVIDERVIAASERLAVLSRHGTGVDLIDLSAATRRGIPVLRAAGANAKSVAEHTIGFIFGLVKNFKPLDQAVRDGQWPKPGYVGRDIAGLDLGIVGFGAVGQLVAQSATALGMSVRVYDPRAQVPENIIHAPSLEALLAQSDVVSLHCPLTQESWHMLDASALALMRKDAFLVNTARGGLVDERALVEALRSGQLAGAALDSFEVEPPAPDNALWDLPNIILTPHIAGAGQSGMKAVGLSCVGNLLDALKGRPLRRACLANPDVAHLVPASSGIKFE
ncbi:hydroxyacid dehydrogenase [Devosia sp. BSSL-BM10]|uniref:Hydroxyacid dehydrogenase n=1 Tax=Devosia litorisediminis TaxID=2829817 RepID=A0A942IET8_9HYPH|nr:hydroxyacid dehydrogenase [Devosia litorisediminis]